MTRDSDDRISAFPPPDGLRLVSPLEPGIRSQWFEAEQVRLNRPVAVKYLHPALAANKAFRERFLDAGRQAAGIIHPAALSIINVFPKQNCVVMQWCTGKPLRNFAGALSPKRVAALGRAILDCLSSLHATGRRHGNLAPGNVFMDDAGGVWIGDFFQPPVFRDEAFAFTGDSSCIAPEVLAGDAGDWTADLFSLGQLLALVGDPARRSDRLAMLSGILQSPDPAKRSRSPGAVMEALERIRRIEDSKTDAAKTKRRARRMYRRVPAEFAVSLRRRSATPEETAVILMKTRDIGESGVFVETDDDLIGVGSILEMDFALKGVEGNVHVFGIVRWRSSPPMPPGVGVQFVEVERSGLTKLREFLGGRRGDS